MKYRLLALDLDGTLLNSKKEITPRTKQAITLAQKQGIHIVLCTGRSICEASEFAKEIPCEDIMVTAGGGAIASASTEQILLEWAMPVETGAKVVEAVEHLPVNVMIYIGNRIYTTPYSNDYFVSNYRVEGFHANKIIMDDIAAHIRKNNFPVTKVYALGEWKFLNKALNQIKLLPEITITNSGSDNFEVMPAGADKGRALLQLGQMLHIHPEQMAAIGDSDNDTAMLKAVGFPIAMGNADENLKRIAYYITADCDHDGIAQAIYKIIQKGGIPID